MSVDPQLQVEWEAVRSDASDKHWVIGKASDDVKSVQFVASGTTGLSDLLAKIDEQNGASMLYAAFRIRAVDDRGSVRSVRFKFIRINVLPSGIPMMRRAKAAQLKPLVDTLFAGTHASFDVSEAKEVVKEDIVRQLQSNAGAHRPNGYEFGGAHEADAATTDYAGSKGGAAAAPTDSPTGSPASATSAPASVVGAQRAAATASPAASPNPRSSDSPATRTDSSPKTPAAGSPSIAAAATGGGAASEASPIPVPEGATVGDCWKQIQSDKEPPNWIMLTNPPTVWKMGAGGVAEFANHLDPSKVIFGGIRVTAIDDRGSVVSVRSKYVFIGFVGSAVKAIQKAQAGPLKSTFEQLLPGTHVSVAMSVPEDLNAQDLEHRLQSCAGAHKPNRYDFGPKPTPGQYS